MDKIANNTLKGKRLGDASVGGFGVGFINIALAVAEGETVVISGDTYEFVDAGTVTAGNIEVSVTGDLTAGNASDQLIAAINANANSAVSATDIDANTILLKTKLVGRTVSLSETMAGAGNTVEDIAHGQYDSLGRLGLFVVVPTAAEVTKGSLTFAPDFTPRFAEANVSVTADGSAKAWDGAVTLDVTNNLVTVDNSGAVDWAVTDTVVVRVYG